MEIFKQGSDMISFALWKINHLEKLSKCLWFDQWSLLIQSPLFLENCGWDELKAF